MATGDEPGFRAGQTIPARGWKIRFDAPPPRGASRRAEQGDILALFKAWDTAPGPEDRRSSPRYVPAETRAWVGWWKGERFVVTPAELVNLSRGGALLALGKRPPSSQPVWVCLGAPHPVDYAQGRVLESTPAPGLEGAHHARLEFHLPCPPAFFLAAGSRGAEVLAPDDTQEG